MAITFNKKCKNINEMLIKIQNNDGYCLCSIIHDEEYKCPCVNFQNMEQGICHCGLYEKIKD